MTPLIIAAIGGHEEMIQDLLLRNRTTIRFINYRDNVSNCSNKIFSENKRKFLLILFHYLRPVYYRLFNCLITQNLILLRSPYYMHGVDYSGNLEILRPLHQ